MSTEVAAAEQAAASAAARAMNIEVWTLYAIGVCITFLRTYAQHKAVGISNFRGDDYLAWVAVIFYWVQTTLGYSMGSLAYGLANNGMTDAEREALSPYSEEFKMRVIGSKIQVAGWPTYSTLICALKFSMLFFYIRLMEGLGRRYRIRIYIGFALVLVTFIASVGAALLSCRPFHNNWQINPDPGNVCQPAISRPVVWVSFASNVITDIYLVLIPIPLLWESSLRTIKKIASSIVLGAGILVLVSATLKSVFVLVDPVNGAQLAGTWGTRETFVAVVTTNLPLIFPLFKVWLKPIFGSMMNSSGKTKQYKTPNLRTIGGGGGGRTGAGTSGNGTRTHYTSHSKGGSLMDDLTVDMTFTESEERIMSDVSLQTLKVYAEPPSPDRDNNLPIMGQGIVVSKDVEIVMDYRTKQSGEHRPQRIQEWY